MLTHDEQAQWDDMLDRLTLDLAEQHYGIIDHFLRPEEINALIAVAWQQYQEGIFKKAGIGEQQDFMLNDKIRGDFIKWIDPETALPPTQKFLGKVNYLMQFINRTCFLGLKDYETHFAIYPPGTFYKRHLDQFRHNDHRRLTFICYLNQNWQPADGGQLRLYFQGKHEESHLDVAPTAGKLLCFRSDILEHEVLLSHANRISVTGWMLDQLHELTFL